jgi:hypothetical protein
LFKSNFKKYSLFASLIIIFFLTFKIVTWYPFFDLISINSYKDIVRIGVTLSIKNSPINQKIQIDNETYIVENLKSEKFKKFINDFPIPNHIYNLDKQKQVVELRNWVYQLLPEFNNIKVNSSYEPESAYQILKDNLNKNTFSKICSADAKIFSSYLSHLGITNRILQLEDHISLEIYNEKNKKWEFHDAHFNDSPKYNGEYISAEFANNLNKKNKFFNYKGPKTVFNTIVYLPKMDLITTKELLFFNIDLNYFRYDNLSLWKPLVVSEESSKIYKQIYK